MLRRSVMTLYSGTVDVYSHQARIVLAEKNVGVKIIHNDSNHSTEDLAQLNPYNILPTLVDRELVLYHTRIILEYLDERFPHPPLLPVYPIAKAKSRLMIYRIEHDWYSLMNIIITGDEHEAAKARCDLKESLASLSPVFAEMPYFLSEDFSLVDCCLAPLLWRLPSLDIELKARSFKAIHDYAQRLFQRKAFQQSLTDAERELREFE